MKVNDMRHQKQELSFDELEAGNTYISHKLQKYVIKTRDNYYVVCLESGQVFDYDEVNGDVFEPVNAVLEIK